MNDHNTKTKQKTNFFSKFSIFLMMMFSRLNEHNDQWDKQTKTISNNNVNKIRKYNVTIYGNVLFQCKRFGFI
jgi:hypothetical protein